MLTRFEESFQRDIDRIRAKITRMAELGERALWDSLKALQEQNRQLAYGVILRDQRVDEMEKELDRLCLEFLVRQQPVAGPLRFAYSTIRVNLELERIGDYAESIARQVLKLIGMKTEIPIERLREIANLAVPMLDEAVRAFVNGDAELAQKTIWVEESVDTLRHAINAELFEMRQQNRIPLEALTPLMTIARRYERVADQARSICQETIYTTTGEYNRHQGQEAFRVLFVDEHNSGLSQLAEGIGNSLSQPRFIFASAGFSPKPVDSAVVAFLQAKGIDVSRHTSKRLEQVPNLEHYQVIIGLQKDVQKALPPPPQKLIYLDWSRPEPKGPEEFEQAYQELHSHIQDLVEAILGDKIE